MRRVLPWLLSLPQGSNAQPLQPKSKSRTTTVEVEQQSRVTFATLEEVQNLALDFEGEFADAEITPKRIGYCNNPIDVKFFRGEFIPIPCSRPVNDQDIDALQLPSGICCASCVEKLLTLRWSILEPEKDSKGRKRRTGPIKRPGPRLKQGRDLVK